MFFSQTLWDVKTSALKQHYKQIILNHYSPIPVFAASARYKQLFIAPGSAKKELLEFMMFLYFFEKTYM